MSENKGSVSYAAWLRRHPLRTGLNIYHGCLETVEGVHKGLQVGAAARKPADSRTARSRVFNGRTIVSAGMA